MVSALGLARGKTRGKCPVLSERNLLFIYLKKKHIFIFRSNFALLLSQIISSNINLSLLDNAPNYLLVGCVIQKWFIEFLLTQISIVLKQEWIFTRSLSVPFITLSGFRPKILIISRTASTFTPIGFAWIFLENHQLTKRTGSPASDLEKINLENQISNRLLLTTQWVEIWMQKIAKILGYILFIYVLILL